MSPLPLLLSVPHAGLEIPEELQAHNTLNAAEIAADGDEGAAALYQPLASHVAAYISSPVARAFIDLNRAEDDIRADGVIKTETCWQQQIYSSPLDDTMVAQLLERYHRPYFARLEAAAEGCKLGLDCHTMAAFAPPIGPDPGTRRPFICLGDGHGSCPAEWAEALADILADLFETAVTVNKPFSGGHITRSRPGGLPWMQLELRRGDPSSYARTSKRILAGLTRFCAEVLAC